MWLPGQLGDVAKIIIMKLSFERNIGSKIEVWDHGLNNYKETKPKCRLYWSFIEFIDWRYSKSCWYFRPAL